MSEQIENEKAYHNTIFGGDNPRAKIVKVYKIDKQKFNFVNELIKSYSKDAKVLEYGCGLDSYAFNIVKSASEVAGIDISDVAVQKNNEQAAAMEVQDRLKFYVMDANNLEFSDNCFDFVYGNSILHHLDIEKAYEEISRVLKPGGHAVFCEPLKYNPVIKISRLLTPRLRTKDEHPLSIKDLKDARKFFGTVSIHNFHLLTLLAIPFINKKCFDSVLSTLERLDRALFKRLPFIRKFSWMVVLDFSDPIK